MFVALLVVAGSATQVWAHPGHSHFSEGLSHALTSGYHIVGLASLGGILVACGFFLRKHSWGMRLQKIGATSLCAAAALWLAHMV